MRDCCLVAGDGKQNESAYRRSSRDKHYAFHRRDSKMEKKTVDTTANMQLVTQTQCCCLPKRNKVHGKDAFNFLNAKLLEAISTINKDSRLCISQGKPTQKKTKILCVS